MLVSQILISKLKYFREKRIYDLLSDKSFINLKTPKLIYSDNNVLRIERLIKDESNTISAKPLIPNIIEFQSLGDSFKRLTFVDLISSPALSVIRGFFTGLKSYGIWLSIKMVCRILLLGFLNNGKVKIRMIHKDLHLYQNMMSTDGGVYFYDFEGSSLTKNYFLCDIVELSIDHENLVIDFSLITEYLRSIGYKKDYDRIALIQIKILLYRRFLHLNDKNKKNHEYMSTVRSFLVNIDLLKSIG
jgi:hypothetical protein